MYRRHRYNLIRFDLSTADTAYKLFVKSINDYVIVKEVTVSDVTVRTYFIAYKNLETNWSNRASLTYSVDIQDKKLVNEGQNWLAAAGKGDAYEYLLDDYSGASAAYSLRLLSSNYTGDAIVVRRDNDNATQSIGFVNNELDTSSLNSFCSGANGFVSFWYDQSGNGLDVTNTIASEQPKIFDSVTGVITEFGKPAISFNGTSQWLDANYTTSQFSQMFCVNNITNDTVVSFSGAVQLQFDRYNTLDDDVIFSANDGLFTLDNINVKGYRNAIDETGSATVFSQTFNRLYIGSLNGTSSFGQGTITELIIYPFANDQSSNRAAIEDNINDRYNIY